MSMPPGLPIPQKNDLDTTRKNCARSLAGLAQYLQSGLTMDQDSEFEYKDSDGTVQGPFLGSQLSEWNEAVRRLLFIPPHRTAYSGCTTLFLQPANQPANQSTLLFAILCFFWFFFFFRKERQLAHLCGAFLTLSFITFVTNRVI